MLKRFGHAACVATLTVSLAFSASLLDSLKPGQAQLKSAGPIAFGPEGILFVGDTMGASIIAIDTGDRKAGSQSAVEVKGIGEKIASLLGTTPDQILVNDLAVNPISRKTYLSVSRGKGPDAAPVILRVDASGKLEEIKLENVRHSSIEMPNAPSVDAKDRRGNSQRLEAITDLAWVDGRVVVAGLSNEEFSSNLRSIPFPFKTADRGASIEIYHGSHGRFETNSPVRTFVPYKIAAQPHILAAYTCTPLVSFPLSSLSPGSKVKGKTIAELGNRNRPLDMVVYQKGGKGFILMNNSSRGVMKLPTEKLDSYPSIEQPTEMKGVPYETISQWKGVEQLDAYDTARAVMLVRDGSSLDLRTVEFP
jgi:hypothetical protein